MSHRVMWPPLARSSPDWLRIRLAVTLAGVVLVNGLLVAAIGWVTIAGLDAGRPAILRSPAAWGVGLLAAGLLLAGLQARVGYRRAIGRADGWPAGTDAGGIAETVTRLSMAADVPPPSVAVVDDPTPTSFTVANGSEATIIVTMGLHSALSDRELAAVLAHEVAHVANRDTAIATTVGTFTGVSAALFRRERRLGDWLRVSLAIAPVSPVLLLYAVPVVFVLVALLVVSLLARIVLAVNAILLGMHASHREYAADRAAAELTGDPAALAGALARLADDRPPTDLRVTPDAALGIVPRPLTPDSERRGRRSPSLLEQWFQPGDPVLGRWLRPDAPPSRALARVGRALEWRPRTHPPTTDRIRALQAMTDAAD